MKCKMSIWTWKPERVAFLCSTRWLKLKIDFKTMLILGISCTIIQLYYILFLDDVLNFLAGLVPNRSVIKLILQRTGCSFKWKRIQKRLELSKILTTQSAFWIKRFNVNIELYGCTTTSDARSLSIMGNTEYVWVNFLGYLLFWY